MTLGKKKTQSHSQIVLEISHNMHDIVKINNGIIN